MKKLEETFLEELKSNPKFSIKDYANLYAKYSEMAIECELKQGSDATRAKSMGNYYMVSVLSDFINSENKLARIIAMHESA